MNNKKELYTKERFLALLKTSFGQYTVKEGQVRFEQHTNQEIARILTMKPQYLSKLLKPLILPEDHLYYEKPPSYQFAIERLLQLEQLKELEAYKANHELHQEANKRKKTDLKRWNKLQLLVTSLLSICALGTIIWYGFFYDETLTNTETNTGLSNEIAGPRIDVNGEFLMDIYPLPTLKEVIRHEGMLTVKSLQLESILFNQRMKKETMLTRKDSLAMILELKAMIHRVVKTVRERNLNFRFSHEYYLLKIANEAVPPDTDLLFQCSELQLMEVAFNSKTSVMELNAKATPFDDGLANSLPYLFNREITFEELITRIGDYVLSNQDQIIKALEANMRAKISNAGS